MPRLFVAVLVASLSLWIFNCGGASTTQESAQSSICKKFLNLKMSLSDCEKSVAALDSSSQTALANCLNDPNTCTPQSLETYIKFTTEVIVKDQYQEICDAAKDGQRFATAKSEAKCAKALSNNCTEKLDILGVSLCVRDKDHCNPFNLSNLTTDCMRKASELFTGFDVSEKADEAVKEVSKAQEICTLAQQKSRLQTTSTACVDEIQDTCLRDDAYAITNCLSYEGLYCKPADIRKLAPDCLAAAQKNFTGFDKKTFGETICASAEASSRLITTTKASCMADMDAECTGIDSEVKITACVKQGEACPPTLMEDLTISCKTAVQKHFTNVVFNSIGEYLCSVAQSKNRINASNQSTCASDLESCSSDQDQGAVRACLNNSANCVAVVKNSLAPACLTNAKSHFTGF